jgi:hypothetical protein
MPLVKILLRHAVIFYITAALLVAVLMSLATGLDDQYLLLNNGVSTLGVVVAPNCEQHLSFSYRFDVAGVTYSGFSVSNHCTGVRAGDEVSVHYLPADPSVSTASDPGELFRNNRDIILMAVLTAPAFLLLIFRVQLRHWQRRHSRQLRPDS